MNNFDTTVNLVLAEDFKSMAAAGMLGLGALGGTPDIQAAEPTPTTQTQQETEDVKFSKVDPKSPAVPANSKDWKGIVVHHTDSSHGDAKEIERWHKERKFNEIGYNYVILKDGTVEKGRSLTKSGAHAKTGKPKSRNSTHVGIVLVKKEGEAPTPQQNKSLGALIISLSKKLDIQSIERHHEQCPGNEVKIETLNKTLQEIRKDKLSNTR